MSQLWVEPSQWSVVTPRGELCFIKNDFQIDINGFECCEKGCQRKTATATTYTKMTIMKEAQRGDLIVCDAEIIVGFKDTFDGEVDWCEIKFEDH